MTKIMYLYVVSKVKKNWLLRTQKSLVTRITLSSSVIEIKEIGPHDQDNDSECGDQSCETGC